MEARSPAARPPSQGEEAIEVTEEYREIFVVEAREHLDEWESALLALESAPGDAELINQIFRAIHTLKGSAGFIGFEAVQAISHELESRLQQVRDGEVSLSTGGTDMLFEGLDLSKRMIEVFAEGGNWDEDTTDFLARLTADRERDPEPPARHESGAAASSRRFRIEVRIESTAQEAQLRAFLLHNRLQAVATTIEEEPDPETLDASVGLLRYAILITSDRTEEEIRSAANVDQVEVVSISTVRRLTENDPAIEPESEEPKSADGRSSAGFSSNTGPGKNGTEHHIDLRPDEVVRVSVDRLDNLLNLVGELVVQNSNFFTLSEELKQSDGRSDFVVRLTEKTEGLAKITRDLQDGIMKVRMLPVNTVFMRFHRVVRDLARAGGKEVAFEIFGGETEIDKKVIDRIGDPLVHLIRNAVDHGIESREERSAAGKEPSGLLRLGAYQDGDHICVEVADDGKGLDPDAIRKKAMEKGLLAFDEEDLTDEQILELIFVPGFSTAQQITDVSGRGVGMDVVKQTIEALGGTLRIRSSVGKGTTVTITLPLTMAIVRAVLVKVQEMTIAVPMSAVKEILKISANDLRTVGGRAVIRLRDEVLAVVHLRELLELDPHSRSSDPSGEMPLIVVEYEGRKVGLGVNRVVGTQEIVIKSLSRHYKEVEGFIGASILGDGTIALIVDAEAVVRRFYQPGGRASSVRDSGQNLIVRQSPDSDEERPVPPLAQVAPRAETPAEEDSLKRPEGAPAQTVDPAQFDETEKSTTIEQAAEILNAVGNSGAIRASMALSQMTGAEVRVGFPDSLMVKISEVADLLGGEETQVAGIYIGITGSLSGGILIVVPAEQLARIESLLLGRKGVVTGEPAVPEDLSAIGEFGNLLSASFINAISDEAEMRVQIEAPELSIDMCLPVIDSVVARFNQTGDRTLLTKAVVFFDEAQEVVCNLLLFLEPESLSRLLESLAAVAQ